MTPSPAQIASATDDLRWTASYTGLRDLLEEAKAERNASQGDRYTGSLAALVVDRLADLLCDADELIAQLAPKMAQAAIEREAEDAEELA